MASDLALDNLQSRRPTARHFAPSWIDRAIAWIEHLPVPAWVFYALVLTSVVLLGNVVRWLEGSQPVFTIDAARSWYAIFVVYGLAAWQYLDRIAAAELARFRPALTITDGEYARLEYELTTCPARPVLVLSLIVLAVSALIFFYFPPVFLLRIGRTPEARAVLYPVLAFTACVTAGFFYHTIRQLRLVSYIHSLAGRINLFQSDPLYAFSALTARTGVVYVLITIYLNLATPDVDLTNPLLLISTAANLAAAMACFVLPLNGMHRRIVAEKLRLQSEANERIQIAIAELHRRVDTRDLADADALNKTLASLQIERDVINKIPTWPWQPGTFAAFATTLTLPIFIYLIQLLLKRFLGL